MTIPSIPWQCSIALLYFETAPKASLEKLRRGSVFQPMSASPGKYGAILLIEMGEQSWVKCCMECLEGCQVF